MFVVRLTRSESKLINIWKETDTDTSLSSTTKIWYKLLSTLKVLHPIPHEPYIAVTLKLKILV